MVNEAKNARRSSSSSSTSHLPMVWPPATSAVQYLNCVTERSLFCFCLGGMAAAEAEAAAGDVVVVKGEEEEEEEEEQREDVEWKIKKEGI